MSAAPAAIAIVDYGMGNRRSVQKAFEHVGAGATITRDHDALREAEALVIPGVGAFPLAIANLRDLGLDALIRERAAEGAPILGICLGLQLLFDRSLELEPTEGLGLIPGDVTPIATAGRRIPHIGWNEVRFEHRSALTGGLPDDGCPFYHVHSLAVRPSRAADVVATTEYGERFATIVEHGSVFGVQFHPEKSSRHGLEMLGNFARVATAGRAPSASAVAPR
jgi:imidazole glycerol-phosphate synthase subunit HisH